MPVIFRAIALLTLFVLVSPRTAAAQERRDSTRRASAISVEEMHRMRRAWLEQRRLGQLGAPASVYGSAVVGAPRHGYATGVGVPLPGYGSPYGGVYGSPYGEPYGVPFGGAGFRCDGFGPGGGRPGSARGWTPFAGQGFGGPCAPVGPGSQPWAGFGVPPRVGLPYPAYPAYGRFYDRFHPDVRDGGGWTDPRLLFGVQEYESGWYAPWRTYPGPLGWSDGAYGWYSAPPWSRSPADCVDLTLEMANGLAHRILVGLQSLGLADPRDLDLAIDARLSEGRPVLLQGLDGRVLRIEPGSPIDDIIVRPCGG